ncbi:hypothetical protein GCM10009623_22090 [Nocardioides aestuarii]|uniref:PLDc N-terminal domain-containing protein n=1 Tax=Nocardioides aestuarii TaxID=252231 RepID=A0ABW4TNX8_9ACTN
MAKTWQDMSDRERTAVLTIGCVQLSLAATAWADLARRPADQVNGPKSRWAAIIAINVVGPILYFTKGRRKTT